MFRLPSNTRLQRREGNASIRLQWILDFKLHANVRLNFPEDPGPSRLKGVFIDGNKIGLPESRFSSEGDKIECLFVADLLLQN